MVFIDRSGCHWVQPLRKDGNYILIEAEETDEEGQILQGKGYMVVPTG